MVIGILRPVTGAHALSCLPRGVVIGRRMRNNAPR